LDPEALAGWWADALDSAVVVSDGFYTVATDGGPALGFQYVAQPTAGKNRVHLDFDVSQDLGSALAKLRAKGALVIRRQEVPGLDWVVMSDPAGNQFCLAEAH
jgi:predicted enzyme related to lactoylglutathione lyase